MTIPVHTRVTILLWEYAVRFCESVATVNRDYVVWTILFPSPWPFCFGEAFAIVLVCHVSVCGTLCASQVYHVVFYAFETSNKYKYSDRIWAALHGCTGEESYFGCHILSWPHYASVGIPLGFLSVLRRKIGSAVSILGSSLILANHCGHRFCLL